MDGLGLMASPYLSIDSTPSGTAGTEAGEYFRFPEDFRRLRADNRVRIGAPVIAITDESWTTSQTAEYGYLNERGWEDPAGTDLFISHLAALEHETVLTYARTSLIVMPAVLHVKHQPPYDLWHAITPPSQEDRLDKTGLGDLDHIYYQRVSRNPTAEEFYTALRTLQLKYEVDQFLGVLLAIDTTLSMNGADLWELTTAANNMGDQSWITLVPGPYREAPADRWYYGGDEHWVEYLTKAMREMRPFLVDPNI